MRQSNAIANTMFVFGPFVLLAFMVVATTPLFANAAVVVLCLIGLALLTISKHSLFRDGIWFSFGPGQLDSKNRRRYYLAYGIITVSMLISLASSLLHT